MECREEREEKQTHSMEEVEFLCVSGSMQCIGNPKQLKARYGGSYVFTMTTPCNEEQKFEKLVRCLSPSANKIYHISGIQKFEIPKHGIRIADIFGEVDEAKRKFPIQAWGLADTTLEDVFIKVARGADFGQWEDSSMDHSFPGYCLHCCQKQGKKQS